MLVLSTALVIFLASLIIISTCHVAGCGRKPVVKSIVVPGLRSAIALVRMCTWPTCSAPGLLASICVYVCVCVSSGIACWSCLTRRLLAVAMSAKLLVMGLRGQIYR